MRKSTKKKENWYEPSVEHGNVFKTIQDAKKLEKAAERELHSGSDSVHRGTRQKRKSLVVVSEQSDDLKSSTCQIPGKKDQDRFTVQLSRDLDQVPHFFGLFDGHGTSVFAADLCVKELLPAMLKYDEEMKGKSRRSSSSSTQERTLESKNALDTPGSTVPCDDAIVKAFVQLDAHCNEKRYEHPRSGTTAVALWMGRDEASPGQVVVKCAWVGDSRAIMVDSTGSVTDLTADHSVHDNESERIRIEDEHDHAPRDGLLDSAGWEMEVVAAEKRGTRLRAGSYVGRREIGGRVAGPRVVFAHTGGVSLQVSRSIGDSLAARSVIPHPEITSFKAPIDGYARFVSASDGVWDVVSSKEAGKIVRSIRDPARAASKLASAAKSRRVHQGRTMDDITVTVVDANPENYKSASSSSSGTRSGSAGQKEKCSIM